MKNQKYIDSDISEIKNLVILASWASLMTVGAWLALPIAGVPITFQTLFVLAAGLRLSSLKAFKATVLYLIVGFVGLPVFSSGMAGLGVLKAPSAGFLLGFPLMAFITGFAHFSDKESFSWLKIIFSFSLAIIVMYFLGALGLYFNANLSWSKIYLLLLGFLPGDILKSILAIKLARFLNFRELKYD